MNKFLQYWINLWKSFDRGDLDDYPDPSPPADLGTPLTQQEIDDLKKLLKEMKERFPSET